MEPHDEIVSALLTVLEPLGGELRLLGRVADPLLGNDSARDAFLFVPDLHLISPARRAAFLDYGFNHEASGLLARLLQRLALLRDHWDATGEHKLVTVQVGDFFDLWREFGLTAQLDSIADDTHGELRDVLYRGVFRGKPCLRATMLLGNHDTKRGVPLPEIPFQLKALNRSANDRPFLFTTHGDALDLLEKLAPDALQEFVVHFLGRLTPVNKYTLDQWGRETARNKLVKNLSDLGTAITTPDHALGTPGGGAVAVTVGGNLPPLLAVTATRPSDLDHGRFADFDAAIGKAAATFPSCEGLRLLVVGHSHEAAMLLCRPPGGRPLVMMDVGAWIEQCTYPLAEGTIVTEPSAQLGVVHGQDARLYQVRVPP